MLVTVELSAHRYYNKLRINATLQDDNLNQPEKWRETIDPFSLSFESFRLCKVLGFPHAGNDVFYVDGVWCHRKVRAFLKVERQPDADIANEVGIIQQLQFPYVPHILDYSINEPRFIVTEELPGERLSTILGNNPNNASLAYLFEFGTVVSTFHQVDIDCKPVKDRRFFHIPDKSYFRSNGIDLLFDYLQNNRPAKAKRCFVHGDCHYANILWKNGHISAVLDYELSGLGNKEFDIAWACLLRPGQKFLNSIEEIDSFLNGYSSKGAFDYQSFAYYFALIGSHFYRIGNGEKGYREILVDLISKVTKSRPL